MKDEIDKFFDQHRKDFGYTRPPEGHEERFLKKLNRQKTQSKKPKKLWLPMAWAASMLLAIVMGGLLYSYLFSSAPEGFVKTTEHFETLVEAERKELVSIHRGDVDQWFTDVEKQLDQLQENQNRLQKDYRRSGRDPRILQAIIQNYQMQIELLNDIKIKIQRHEKQQSNEYQEI